MAGLSLRDRFFTPPVARAVTSPLGILALGAGASDPLAAAFAQISAHEEALAALSRGDVDVLDQVPPWHVNQASQLADV
ncbi:MAG: hypothetical protein ABL966_12410, partial [Acidimicrobiales bacterium]